MTIIKMITGRNKKIFSTTYSRYLVENLEHNVNIVDRDDENELDLYCYSSCDNNTSDKIKKCRGLVYNRDTLVLNAFPYTTEYNNEEIDIINEKIGTIFSECVFFDSYEGSLLRMFNFNGKWFISTHRKLDAFKSRWSSNESFGVIFTKTLETEYEKNGIFREILGDISPEESVLEKLQTILNPSYQYMFLVLNTPENRIVCLPPEKPTLYHVGTFVEGGVMSLDVNIGISHTDRKNFTNIEEVINFVRNDVNIEYLQGVICFAPNNIQYKIVNRQYQELFKIRGNEPSLKFRYIQLRMDKSKNETLYNLYPEKTKIFDDCENSIYNLASKIYKLYVMKYIKKQDITSHVSNEEVNILKKCHYSYKNNINKTSLNLNKVIEIINNEQPRTINSLIKVNH